MNRHSFNSRNLLPQENVGLRYTTSTLIAQNKLLVWQDYEYGRTGRE